MTEEGKKALAEFQKILDTSRYLGIDNEINDKMEKHVVFKKHEIPALLRKLADDLERELYD